MHRRSNLLSLTRPVTSVLIIAIYMATVDRELPIMALLAVGAAFFIASSAILNCWIPVPPKWESRVIWAEIAATTVLCLTTVHLNPGGPMLILYYPSAFSIFVNMERRQWLPTSLFLGASWALVWFRTLPSMPGIWSVAAVAIYASLLAFAGGAGLLARNLTESKSRSDELLKQFSESQAALERAHRQLRDSIASQQEMAVLEERQRLAREIHDSVAHSLTALVVQTQAARRLLERAPDQAAETIARCEEMAREALLETRRAVRALHPSGLEQQVDVEALTRLGRDFGIATGVSVEVSADAAAAALPPDPARLEQLYRIFQESLTNAHRHGRAKQVRARLTMSGNLLRMQISNDGLPPASLEPGIGLKSMAERARALGGEISVTPGTIGLTLVVTVPIALEAVK